MSGSIGKVFTRSGLEAVSREHPELDGPRWSRSSSR